MNQIGITNTHILSICQENGCTIYEYFSDCTFTSIKIRTCLNFLVEPIGGMRPILDRSILASEHPVRYISPPLQISIEFAGIHDDWVGSNMRARKTFFAVSGEKITANLEIVFLCLALLWAIYFLNLALPFDLRTYGIRPRNIPGLSGLLFAPVLHHNIGHLFSNSLVLAPLLFFSLAYSRKLTLEAVICIALIGGAGTWLFGRSHTVHIGASGIIFGLIGYLLAIGLFRRELLALIVSLAIAFYYGWALFSLFVVLPGVSWAGHFFGFLAGAFAAWLTRHMESRSENGG
jgi:membrane associated rhomboid family serine protease